MIHSLRTILKPALFHGHGRKPPFFEGWYYKLVDAKEECRYAVIPGVFLSNDPDRHHAFIQILDGETGHSTYHRYPVEAFHAAKTEFDLHIGPNHFRKGYLSLDIDRPEQRVCGRLDFADLTPWPVTLLSPGIMGWYAWVPLMECYHGVISLDHRIDGDLLMNDLKIDLTGGRGYIEKDWGKSFPTAWIWLQTNHFGKPGDSLTASIAIIPWLKTAFPGFIIGLWHDKILYRFATYTGARIEALEFTDESVTWVVRDHRHRLEMHAIRAEGGLLQAPTTADMGRRISETLNARIKTALYSVEDCRPRLIFEGTGLHAGLETVGPLDRLRSMWASKLQPLGS